MADYFSDIIAFSWIGQFALFFAFIVFMLIYCTKLKGKVFLNGIDAFVNIIWVFFLIAIQLMSTDADGFAEDIAEYNAGIYPEKLTDNQILKSFLYIEAVWVSAILMLVITSVIMLIRARKKEMIHSNAALVIFAVAFSWNILLGFAASFQPNASMMIGFNLLLIPLGLFCFRLLLNDRKKLLLAVNVSVLMFLLSMALKAFLVYADREHWVFIIGALIPIIQILSIIFDKHINKAAKLLSLENRYQVEFQ